MNREQACQLLALPVQDFISPQDLEEAYEQLVFEFKQFFSSKVPLDKLFASRLQKLTNIHDAYLFLGGSEAEKKGVLSVTDTFRGPIEAVFNDYQLEKSHLKRSLLQAVSALNVVLFAEALLELEKNYASCWYHAPLVDETVLVSKEPDPMDVLTSIKMYALNGGTLFAQLRNQENNPPELLLHEMKRLSLLFKKYGWTSH